MSIQIFLHSKRLREHSNQSKNEFHASYVPSTLKYVYSNFFSLKETKRAPKSLKREVSRLICTSNSQVCPFKYFFIQRDKEGTQITQKNNSSPHMHLKLSNASHHIVMPQNCIKNIKISEQEKITTSRSCLLQPPVDTAPPEAHAATIHSQQGCIQISTSTSMSGPITY